MSTTVNERGTKRRKGNNSESCQDTISREEKKCEDLINSLSDGNEKEKIIQVAVLLNSLIMSGKDEEETNRIVTLIRNIVTHISKISRLTIKKRKLEKEEECIEMAKELYENPELHQAVQNFMVQQTVTSSLKDMNELNLINQRMSTQ